MNKMNVPTIIVIFGGTGDLTQKKLIPSLFDLYVDGFLPDTFKIVGFARQELSNTDYQDFVRKILIKKNHNIDQIEDFITSVSYVPGDFTNNAAYHTLTDSLKEIDNTIGMCTNKLYHLAVPPSFYLDIFENIKESNLAEPCDGDIGWTRILVEKPFGNDSETAHELDRKLGKMFDENQIFRIDHYLAKDALQNILTFRFSNTLFEQSWNNKSIEKIHIKLYENFGVETRGSFYDSIGAFRDVGQNHMLQMLALIAMNNPLEMKASKLRRERLHILNSLKIYSTEEEIKTNTIRGQYEGFKDIKNVSPTSTTETYFLVKAMIENEKWQGVPFYLESGKALDEQKIEIDIHFKSANPCMCGNHEAHDHKNILTFNIQPKEGISVQFLFKKPGILYGLDRKQLSFDYDSQLDVKENNITHLPDAYAKVLYDCIMGDQTSFVSTDEVEAAWNFITPILENWHTTPLHIYAQGSSGPEERNELLK